MTATEQTPAPLGSAPVPRSILLDVAYDRVRLAEVMDRIQQACRQGTPLQIVTVNLNFVTLARRDPLFVRAIREAGLSVVDGKILQIATRLVGEPAPEHITGHDLVRESIALAQRERYGIFLLGAAPGVAAEVAQKLERDHPGLRAMGTHHGNFTRQGTTERQSELVQQIREFSPKFLFVGLGAPKQDLWLARHLAELSVPVGIGVGCVIDVLAGRMPRAPRWVQRAGLESPFQLVTTPRRYAKRYLVDDIPTLLRVAGFIARRRLLG